MADFAKPSVPRFLHLHLPHCLLLSQAVSFAWIASRKTHATPALFPITCEMSYTKKVGRVSIYQSSCNRLTYNNLYISCRFSASFLPFLVLPEELRGREPSELEQYALLIEVPHRLVYHLGGHGRCLPEAWSPKPGARSPNLEPQHSNLKMYIKL